MRQVATFHVYDPETGQWLAGDGQWTSNHLQAEWWPTYRQADEVRKGLPNGRQCYVTSPNA